MSQDESKISTSVPTHWLIGLAIACVVFLLAEFSFKADPHVKYEGWFGFFGMAAFVGMSALALMGQLLRSVLQRDREYYDV